MPNILSTSLTGMLAFQRAMELTGHNIANSNTPGYSRQVAEFDSRAGMNAGSIGSGTKISSIKRIYDELLGVQHQTSLSGQARLSTVNDFASRIDGLLADGDTGLSTGLRAFFNSLQDVTNDPASTTARQMLVGGADSIVSRFHLLARRFDEIGSEVNSRLTLAVADINQLATAIADINHQIGRASAFAGKPPNDLLDSRDALVRRLSEQVAVTTTMQEDGAMNVFIGSGQTLVIGNVASQLTVGRSEFDPTRLTIAYEGTTPVESSLTGGNIGGLLEFRSRMLEPAQQALGQTAVAFATSFNQQHSAGMDLKGNLGGDFFSIDPPGILYSANNTGSGTVVATVSDLGQFTGSNYVLEYDGSSYTLRRADTNQSVTLTGSGTGGDPFAAEGISIVVAGVPAAGDRVMIRSGERGAASIENLVTDPQAIAIASPTRFQASLSNVGRVNIGPASVVDSSDPGLLTTSVIAFTSATTYSINGAGSFTYTSGDPIVINGSSVTIEGTPVTGDQFTLEANVGASGDNGNGLLLADLQSGGLLEGGTVSTLGNYSQLVANVGITTRQARANLDAQNIILANIVDAQLSVSGVNLDEEAANLIRFQQAYQAAAQVVAVASTLFDSLINATRR